MDITDLIVSFLSFLFNVPVMILEKVGEVTTNALTFSGGELGAIMGMLKSSVISLMPYLQGVGYAIVCMFFILGLLNLCLSERLTLELFIKQFVYLAVGVGFVYYSIDLFEALLEFGNSFTTFVSNHFTLNAKTVGTTINTLANKNPASASAIEDSIRNIITSTKGLTWLLLAAIGIIFGGTGILIAAGLLVVIYVITFTRIIEIYVRGAFLPVGFALLADDGYRGAGGRFFKKFIAICSQGAVISVTGKIISMMVSIVSVLMFSDFETIVLNQPDVSAFTDALKTLCMNVILGEIMLLGVAIAGIIALFKSIHLINDIFGV